MKLIIGSLTVFSLIILFLFALFPARISVTRMLRIAASREQVNKKIRDLREWKNWNEFLMHTPRNHSLQNQPDRVDSIFLIQGGVSVSVLKSLPDTVITRWQQGDKFFTGNYTLTEMGGQTMVEWTLHFHIKWYPWEKLASMFYEKQLGPVMEKSLLNLQKQLEAG